MSRIDSKPEIQDIYHESSKELSFDYGARSEKSKALDHLRNEDSVFFNKKNDSFGIFDGVGGSINGEESSKLCSNLIQTELKNLPQNISPEEAYLKLKEILKTVNETLIKNKSKYGLGESTGTFGIICSDNSGKKTAVIANVGDSRAYLYRRENKKPLIQLTTDDDAFEKKAGILQHKKNINLVEFNQIEFNQIIKEPDRIREEINNASSEKDISQIGKLFFQIRNVIGKCFGSDFNYDTHPNPVFINLQEGDILLLTTDGIHDNLTTRELNEDLSYCSDQKLDANEISNILVNHAIERSQQETYRSKKDDITALVIECKSKKNDQLKPDNKKAPLSNYENKQNGNEKHQDLLPRNFTPNIGQEIIVQRSELNGSGISGGWIIYEINSKTGELTLHKKIDGNKTIVKTTTISNVERFNRQARIEDISTSKNLTQLIYTLDKLGGLQGSNKYFSINDLITSINYYLDGEIGLEAFTQVGGLRDTIKRLIQEKNKKQ